jgi:hypothetical protein
MTDRRVGVKLHIFSNSAITDGWTAVHNTTIFIRNTAKNSYNQKTVINKNSSPTVFGK